MFLGIVPLYDIVEGLLEDSDLTAELLAGLTGIPLADLQAFLSGTIEDLSPAQYHPSSRRNSTYQPTILPTVKPSTKSVPSG